MARWQRRHLGGLSQKLLCDDTYRKQDLRRDVFSQPSKIKRGVLSGGHHGCWGPAGGSGPGLLIYIEELERGFNALPLDEHAKM